MRALLIGLAVLLVVGVWWWLEDVRHLRATIKEIEGTHQLDLVSDGRVEGTYVFEFKQLPDGGFLSRLNLNMIASGGLDLANDSSLEFSGFPFYALRTVRTKHGSNEIALNAADLPTWSLSRHLVLQRLAVEGRAFLDRWQRGIEILEDGGEGRARFKAPVFDRQEVSITFTEFEVEWRREGGVTVHRQGGWIDFDGSGRMERAHLTPYHQLLPAGSTPRKESRDDRSAVQVLGAKIEHPDLVEVIEIEIDPDTSTLFDSKVYAPVQTLDGNVLALTRVPQDIPRHISDLVALVHHSLIYDESFNATDVDEIMANGRGDCTEFTDLFHHMARTSGIETRKILGLAYLDKVEGRPPGFYAHAWNQVKVDGRWLDVDATWNQAPTSALRIRFPQDAAQQVVLMRRLRHETLRVVSVNYS